MAAQIADLVLVRFAHVQDEKIIPSIQPCFEFARSYLGNFQTRRGSFFAAHAAEFVVVDELVNGSLLSADRARRILAKFEFAELHAECVEQKQSAGQTISTSKDQLDRFHRLDGANDAR